MESGSQKVLNSIGKNYDLDEAAIRLCEVNKLGIEIRVSLTFGYKEEDIDTYDETINVINRLKPNAIAFFFLKVYPGTPLYKQAVSEHYISDDFWFADECTVPYFEKYKSYTEFINTVKPYILNGVNVTPQSVHNDGRDDSEYYFNWNV